MSDIEDLEPITDEDLLQNQDFQEKRDSANVKDNIEQIKKTPVTHTNFEGFREKVASQRQIIKSHAAYALDLHKKDREKFNVAIKADKDKWWENTAPRVPTVKYAVCLLEDRGVIISHYQDLISLYEATIARYEDALKNAKTMDITRETMQELSKLNAENNKFQKDMMAENNKMIKEAVQLISENYSKNAQQTFTGFLEQLKTERMRARDFEEKVLHILLAHQTIKESDMKSLSWKQEQKRRSRDDDEISIEEETKKVEPLTVEQLEAMKPKDIPGSPILEEQKPVVGDPLLCPIKGCGYKASNPMTLEIHKNQRHGK